MNQQDIFDPPTREEVIDRLGEAALGRVEMSQNQIRASEIFLKHTAAKKIEITLNKSQEEIEKEAKEIIERLNAGDI